VLPAARLPHERNHVASHMKDMGTFLRRVEIELVELAAAMTSVLAVLAVGPLFGGLFNGTVGVTPPWRPVVVSSA